MANIFFGKGKKQQIVVDASRLGLKVLQLLVEEDSIKIEKVFYAPWSFYLSETEDDFLANLDTVLKSLTSSFPGKQHSVIFCFSDPSNLTRWYQTSVIEDEEELEEYLLGKKVMRSQEEYHSDFIVAGESISDIKKAQDVLIHSVHGYLSQNVMDAFEERGFELETLDFPVNAQTSFYEYFCEEGRTPHDAMISIGWETSSLSIFCNNEIRFTHYLNFRLCEFSELLMHKMQIDEGTAQHIVRTDLFEVLLNNGTSQYPIPEDCLTEIKEELAYLVNEIERVFAFYVARVLEWKIERVERIIYAGMETYIDPLHTYLSSYFKVPSSTISPITSLGFSSEAQMKMDEHGCYEHFNTALGIFLRHLGEE